MRYFTIKEFSASAVAKKRGISNIPSEECVNNIGALVCNVLDPLREAYGKPITVNSGYRSMELNRAVGGSETSDHLSGRAADITAGDNEENRELFELILSLDLPFDQLIDESDFCWIHVSFRESGNRRQILKL
jgi:hypothetical protein